MIFQIPVYIQQIKSGYLAQPLFSTDLRRTDTDLQRLTTKLNRELVQKLETLAKQDRHDEVSQWAFAPNLSQQRIKFQLVLQRRTVKVAYLLVTFRHLGKRLAFTPSLPELWFEYGRNELVEHRAQEVITDYWRQLERDADDEEEIRPEAETLTGQAWVQIHPISVQLPKRLRPPAANILQLLGGDGGVVDGSIELHRVGRCLDWLYPQELERATNRDSETEELMRLLNDVDNRPVLLVGPRLIGKSTLVQECVFRRSQLRNPYRNSCGQVWLISPQRLISGMSYVGQWESRLIAILKYASKREHVLYFDDLIGLFLAGRSANSSLNVAQVLKPYLEERKIRLLGEITPEALRVLRELDRGFADLFHHLPLREVSEQVNLQILLSVQRRLEAKHRVDFALNVLPTVIDLQRRYERSASFPGKAATVLNRLAIRASTKAPSKEADQELGRRIDPLFGRAEIQRSDVFGEFTGRTGLSFEFLDPQTRFDRASVRQQLQAQVVGQSEAIDALADVVSIAKARLNDPDRPLAAFLFLGPTGVGKTESAKALARTLFGNEERLLRFDLNEFNQPGSAARLFGTLAQPEGLLTAGIRRQPFAVVLLDEIEKADPDVFDVLLQVLGEGRLTDALGRTADFTNAILILTSNLGVREAEGGVGFIANPNQSGAFTRAAERFFRPEFFNRLDRVIPFQKLTKDEMGTIARWLVRAVLQREGFAQRKCILSVSPEALDQVIQVGYDPLLGARAMKRAVEQQVVRPASARLAALEQNALTIVSIVANPELTVLVQAPGLAERMVPPSGGTTAERVEGIRNLLDDFLERIEPLRPIGGISGKVTADQERYYTIKEQAEFIAKRLDRLEDLLEQQRLTRIGSSSSHAFARRPRYRAITEPKDYNPMGRSALKVLMSSDNMEQAIDDLLQDAQPVDEDQELYEIDRQLALLKVMVSCEPDDKPVYLWIRGTSDQVECNTARELAERYRSAWSTGLGLELSTREEDQRSFWAISLEIKGLHARSLAQLEVGTHLILPKHGGPIPLRVRVLDRPPSKSDQNVEYGPILRLYPEDKPVIDLRSGLVAPQPLSDELFRAFTLAAIP